MTEWRVADRNYGEFVTLADAESAPAGVSYLVFGKSAEAASKVPYYWPKIG